jgi:hypothetical protein
MTDTKEKRGTKAWAKRDMKLDGIARQETYRSFQFSLADDVAYDKLLDKINSLLESQQQFSSPTTTNDLSSSSNTNSGFLTNSTQSVYSTDASSSGTETGGLRNSIKHIIHEVQHYYHLPVGAEQRSPPELSSSHSSLYPQINWSFTSSERSNSNLNSSSSLPVPLARGLSTSLSDENILSNLKDHNPQERRLPRSKSNLGFSG